MLREAEVITKFAHFTKTATFLKNYPESKDNVKFMVYSEICDFFPSSLKCCLIISELGKDFN